MNLPPIVNRMADDAKTKSTSDYRSMMNGLLHTLLDIEDAVTDNKPDDIKKGLAKVEEIMNEGHKEFRPARGGPGGGRGD